MTDEYTRAKTFANSYFDLVDGLAYGLEDYLAEDVSLYWFGKIVNGKRNVAAFMRINMTNSKHMFDEITPASSIPQRKKSTPRIKHKSKESSTKNENVTDALVKSGLNFAKLSIEDSNKLKKETLEPEKPSSVLPGEISVENIVENSVKRENNEKDDNSVPLIPKMDCESIVPTPITDDSSIKFIKANGIVHIYRPTGPNKIRKWQSSAFVSGLPGQNCRRHCKLRVAYTLHDETTKKFEKNRTRTRSLCVGTEESTETSEIPTLINEPKATTTKGKKRFNSQEEEDEKKKLEANVDLSTLFDPFEDFDSFDDKQRFLEYYRTEMTPRFNFTTAKYIGDRLVFDRTTGGTSEETRKNCSKSFKFDYIIKSLVYESNASSNLDEEFEDRTSLSDTEKSV